MPDPPQIIREGKFLIVRDDLFPGGTKARVLPDMLRPGVEYVYASPAYGYAQIALAYTCRAIGARATVFVAARKSLHKRSAEAASAGANVITVPMGFLSNVQAKARAYVESQVSVFSRPDMPREYLPCGFDSTAFLARLSGIARQIDFTPAEVWSVAGTGTLNRALQLAWPSARFYAVRTGMVPDAGRAEVFQAPEDFPEDAEYPPPFPSCSNYDAKAWRFMVKHAAPDALFWNVAG